MGQLEKIRAIGGHSQGQLQNALTDASGQHELGLGAVSDLTVPLESQRWLGRVERKRGKSACRVMHDHVKQRHAWLDRNRVMHKK